ncbi:MAG TPA: hypothetical protein VFT59_00605 [Candidatus Saccharimonadales bacterium]|nr:hypothetical protein [Candidatus Saccharimonadales bacterium]
MESSHKPFSVIRFFDHFKKLLEAIDTPPLSLSNLAVQKDALAQIADEDREDFSFAHLGIDFPTSFHTLLFSLDLFRGGVGITIDNQGMGLCDYTLIADSEAEAAQKVVNVLQALSNGQIAYLFTYSEGGEEPVQAVEVLYKQPGDTVYAIRSAYPAFDTRLKNGEYNTILRKNDAPLEEVAFDLGLLSTALPIDDPMNIRDLFEGPHVPFTYALWQQTVKANYDKKGDELADRIKTKADAWIEKLDKSTERREESKTTLPLSQSVKLSGRFRHAELRLEALAMAIITIVAMSNPYTIGLLLGAIVTLIIAPWRRLWQPWHWTQVALSYGIFTVAAVLFVIIPAKDVFWWIVAILSTVSLIETIAWDGFMLFKRMANRQ